MLNSKDYNMVIEQAFQQHYTEQSDVWTTDIGMRILPLLIQGKLRLSEHSRVLDIGCGSGLDTLIYSELSSQVTGIDIYAHPEWQSIQEQFYNITFYRANFLQHPIDEYDLVIDNGCFHHQANENLLTYLLKVKEILSDNGHFVLSTFYDPTTLTYVDNYERIHHYFSDQDIEQRLNSAGFNIMDTIYIYRKRYKNYYRISFCKKI
ncbi:class I SAM-dependent DNA methyltransferase [Pectobacterium sp. A5351]|uniref:class I SAM-dependent DNA methyltransferase n=1 Tax=Pectobacterium sp. A5351 TaxID=2914983 RepID=UPI0023311A33|nr:class I SAM-dependent methyltransferase [Pectobacterium sp. A5351]WCG82318.1 class I SAM-dependent methyltransferase [Pectobacterium sp. A5351]